MTIKIPSIHITASVMLDDAVVPYLKEYNVSFVSRDLARIPKSRIEEAQFKFGEAKIVMDAVHIKSERYQRRYIVKKLFEEIARKYCDELDEKEGNPFERK